MKKPCQKCIWHDDKCTLIGTCLWEEWLESDLTAEREKTKRLEHERFLNYESAKCWKTKAERLEAELEQAREETVKFRGLLEELTDPDPCEYDHGDNCQSHLLHQRPCPHERATEALKGGEES